MLQVPRAPGEPDSDPTPVSINDYLQYCDLSKSEIRSQVFGHLNPFKDIKRRYVFQILYGQYDVEVARTQDELRELRTRLRALEMDGTAFERLMDGTPWHNRVGLVQELNGLTARRDDVVGEERRLARRVGGGDAAQALRQRIRELDESVAEATTQCQRETEDVARMQRLSQQIETQIGRLTRAIVAGETLLDIDFVVCPRCGSGVNRERAAAHLCYLCLLEPQPGHSRDDLVKEQDRLAEQLGETNQLIDSRRRRLKALKEEKAKRVAERESVGRQLDERSERYVSDAAQALQERAAERATLEQQILRLQDYLRLFDKRDAIASSLAGLKKREEELLAELDGATARSEEVDRKVQYLEERFTHYLRQFALPSFLGDVTGTINRRTFMPRVSGRAFDELQSEGLAVEVNVAHALAHHSVALELGLKLPAILFLDGISGAFGDEGFDPARVEAIYEQVAKLCDDAAGELQVVAVDTTLPRVAREHVALELSESDRLVPEEDVVRLRAASD